MPENNILDFRICKICGEEILQEYKLANADIYDADTEVYRHVISKHNLTLEEYYFQYFRKPGEGICIVCGSGTSLTNLKSGMDKECCCDCISKRIKYCGFDSGENNMDIEEASNMKELDYKCPYCGGSRLDTSYKATDNKMVSYCWNCNKEIDRELMICKHCLSQARYYYGLRFCMNKDCPSYHNFYDCENYDPCNPKCENCTRRVIKIMSGEVNYKSRCYRSFGEPGDFSLIYSVGFLHNVLRQTSIYDK